MKPRSEDEVLRHNVWNLGYLLTKISHLLEGRVAIEQPLAPGVYEVVVEDVISLSDELHPKVLTVLRIGKKVEYGKEDQPMAAEYGEGDVPDERLDQRAGPGSPATRYGSRRSDVERPGGPTLRSDSNGPSDKT